ncbi:hypothetical protein AWF91_20530 [Escherichia coli]|nr:hypothetical protein AWF48_18555 [Escherichia coli]KUX81987.1 hypothetical protein AWF91_20530 [Escherichia coli]KZH36576.1 hypothetical protein AWG36_20645 [Escherichia coli]KZH56733.1 hypothetical protein AWG49_12980 [Escherichia coli]KZI22095.1 hypothetical protein AWG66_02050 [Escherichia coli]
MSDSQTLVVKLGTSVLTGGSRRLNRAHIVELVRQCAQLHAAGHRIVIVTSGAIRLLAHWCRVLPPASGCHS